MPRQYTPRASLICVRCGQPFTVEASRALTARLCSAACRDASAPIGINADGSISIPMHARNGSVRGYVTVDADDAEWALQWRWCMNTHGYAVRVERVAGRSSSSVFMHRELMGLTPGDSLTVDHIDRVRLNNRRCNLRSVPREAQTYNRSSTRGSSSKYRGVCWDKRALDWVASVKINGKTKNLGHFPNESDAATAAKAARLRLMPYAVD